MNPSQHEVEQKLLIDLQAAIKAVKDGDKSESQKAQITNLTDQLIQKGINLRGLLRAKELEVIETFAKVAIPNPKPKQ